jgi:outer membrane immunogenic protein
MFTPKEFSGGIHIGYLTQIGRLAAGFEVSYSGGPLAEQTRTSQILTDRTRTIGIGNVASATLRMGWTEDRWLTYVRGGLAAALINVRTNIASTGELSSASSEYDYGYTIGAGIEYALTDTLSAGLEYSYFEFAAQNRGPAQLIGYAPLAYENVRADAHLISARVTYRLTH